MHVRVVEVVAVDAPGLVEDLLPLGPRVDADLDGVEVQLALAAARRSAASVDDGDQRLRRRVATHERLLAVGASS